MSTDSKNSRSTREGAENSGLKKTPSEGSSFSKGRVVILEDDQVLLAAMKSAFSREGFEVFASGKPDEVLQYVNKNQPKAIFIDCLLPGTSGVDFLANLKKENKLINTDSYLMSGLFTDSAFVRDSIRSTQAKGFIKKPFDIKEILDLVKPDVVSEDSEKDVPPRKALYQLFSKTKVTLREKRKAIEALEDVHGFDLPFLYSLLVETKATGHLNIMRTQGDIFGVSFSQGKIVQVDILDQETQLGKLLIEAGFILPDDLESALSISVPKRLGEKLINNNLLSPHAFNIALANQMSIRLSRTIFDEPIKINFVTSEVELTYPHIDSDSLSSFLHDWIASKISLEWLKTHYMQWGDYKLILSPGFNLTNSVLSTPLLEKTSSILDILTKGVTLNQLMEVQGLDIETTYKSLHLLAVRGLVIFIAQKGDFDDVERRKKLQKIFDELRVKSKLDAFDFVVQLTGCSESDGSFIFDEFIKLLGEEPLPTQKELHQIYVDLKHLVESVIDFGSGESREKLKEEKAKSDIELKIRAASQFEEAKQCLQKSQYQKALSLLQKVNSIDSNVDKIKLHLIWARLGVVTEVGGNRQKIVQEVELELLQVPPEEKFDALYSFVVGLYNKLKGDFITAKKSFEKAINLDSTMIVARRELNSIQALTMQKTDLMNRDLKDLVSSFFKKK